MLDYAQQASVVRQVEQVMTAKAGQAGFSAEADQVLLQVREATREVLWGIEGWDDEDVESIASLYAHNNIGLGPVDSLLQASSVSEIMVQCPRGGGLPQTFVEVSGQLYRTDVVFRSVEQLERVILRIGQGVGRSCTASSPIMDARLADGSRVLATHSSMSPDGPVLVVRKFNDSRMTLDDLVSGNAMSQDVADFLKSCIEARVNIVVTGGTGSGKTTLLNVLASLIPKGERVITIEDPCELKIEAENLVRWEARRKNAEGQGEVTIADLVVAALRGRPDRIVVGEVRSVEAVDMLQAMTTGHDGSLTTLHANDPATALSRLRSMVQEARPNGTIEYVDAMVASAIELIVHTERDAEGHRHVSRITAVEGYRDGTVIRDDIFVRKESDEPGGSLVATGSHPGRARARILRQGKPYDRAWFAAERAVPA